MIKNILLILLTLIVLAAACIFTWYLFNRTTDYDGHWCSEDAGFYLNIKGGIIRSYQYEDGDIVWLPLFAGLIKDHQLSCYISDFDVQKSGDELHMVETSGGTYYSFKSLSEKLSVNKKLKNDPYYNFDMFYKSFKNHYAYFDLYGVDWDAQYNTYRSKINENTTNEELTEILKEMTAPLKDGHISFDWLDESWCPVSEPSWYSTENLRGFVGVISDNYIQGEVTYLTGRAIRYGRINDEIGYISIASMAVSEKMHESYEIMTADFDQAISALKDTDTLILDLRFNEGGYDAFGRYAAGYFTDEMYLAYSRQMTNHTQEANVQGKFVEPNGKIHYTGKVYILTSGLTVSAAETFILCMEQLDNVVFIGEETAGFYSDALPRVLPNGGMYTLSFETFHRQNGTIPEGSSTEIDHVIELDTDNIVKGIDPAIDFVIENKGSEE